MNPYSKTFGSKLDSNNTAYKLETKHKVIRIIAKSKSESSIENRSPAFTLYPNPTSESIHLCTEELPVNSEWKICDALGRIQKHGSINATETIISIKDLSMGNYYFIFNDGILGFVKD